MIPCSDAEGAEVWPPAAPTDEPPAQPARASSSTAAAPNVAIRDAVMVHPSDTSAKSGFARSSLTVGNPDGPIVGMQITAAGTGMHAPFRNPPSTPFPLQNLHNVCRRADH